MSDFKIKIRGHESFYIREGWIRKGIEAIKEEPYILSDTTKAIDELGVGSAMVKSIRYWLQALGLTEEVRGESGKRIQKLTENFGELLYEKDPYFEDLGTLFLLHYKLVTNKNLATTWYLYFNKIKSYEMSKEMLEEGLKQQILNLDPTYSVSEKSLKDDCNCIVKTYYADKNDLKNPEDNMISPMVDLGLIKKVKYKNKDEMIIKCPANKKKLDKLIVLYVISENMKDKKEISINSLIEDESNIGKVFNLDKNAVNYYIDELELENYLKIVRTAGLNTIQLNNIYSKQNILEKYYTEY